MKGPYLCQHVNDHFRVGIHEGGALRGDRLGHVGAHGIKRGLRKQMTPCYTPGFDHLDLCLVGFVRHHLVQGGDNILAEDALVAIYLRLLLDRSNLLRSRANVQGETELIWTKTGCDEVEDLCSVALNKLRMDNVT